MKQTYYLHGRARQNALQAVQSAPEGYRVIVSEPARTLDQNAALWAALTEISEQVQWHGRWLTPDDWKVMFTASLRQQQIVPNLEGTGFVVLGLSTSKMTKREFGDLLDLIGAFCAERGVQLREVA